MNVLTLRRSHRLQTTTAMGLVLALAHCCCPEQRATAEPIIEQLGDPNLGYWDSEVWGPTLQMTYQDTQNIVWIADLDPQTGRMIPPDGRGIRVGPAMPIISFTDLPFSLNGPEFGFSQSGLEVFFTQYDENRIGQIARYRFADGQTQRITKGGRHHRTSALPSQNPLDPETSILSSFLPIDRLPIPVLLSWRRESEPRTDRLIPIARPSSNGPRWIDGEFAVLTNVVDRGGFTQIARFDLLSEGLTLLTSGPGNKFNPSIFNPPEFVPNRGLLLEDDSVGLAIYRETTDGWELDHTIPYPVDPDSGRISNFFDSKTIVFQGHTYVATALQQPVLFPFLTGFGDVFVYSFDGTQRVKLNEGPKRTRNRDPEVLVTDDDVWIYYFSLLVGEQPSIHLARRFLDSLGPID